MRAQTRPWFTTSLSVVGTVVRIYDKSQGNIVMTGRLKEGHTTKKVIPALTGGGFQFIPKPRYSCDLKSGILKGGGGGGGRGMKEKVGVGEDFKVDKKTDIYSHIYIQSPTEQKVRK